MADYFKQGSHASTARTNLISLYGSCTSGNFTTYRAPGQSSGYQVPSGKTLVITRVHMSATSGTGWYELRFFYGDSDVGQNSASGPSNSVTILDAAAGTYGPLSFLTNAPGFNDVCIMFSVPALKYIAGKYMNTNFGSYIEGYLE